MQAMKIGELARSAGVSVQAVRYYESRGLMPEPKRTRSGYRQYGDNDLVRLRFIGRAQALGFTLSEIADLLELRVDPSADPDDLREQVRDKIRDLDRKLRDLERIRFALEHLLLDCEAGESSSDCPLLDSLGETAPFNEERGVDRRSLR